MITTKLMSAAANNDAHLVSESLSGNREAFGQIVARYQSLVCSLAYNATGSLSQSEDLAQETFMAAWKQLSSLREPEKLRPWLCGIARNLIHSAQRRQGREPSHAAESLESAGESPSHEASPPDQTISREEEAILWRSIERIPETYREPLILFYREHQSVERVAAALELSEDAVHQRLSRGRKLLAEEVMEFVAGALERTNPGAAFTIGVLAALPVFATSAKAATVATVAAKGGAAATGATFLSVLGIGIGPLLGLAGGYVGARMSLKNAATPRERAFMVRYIWTIVATVAVFVAALLALIFFAGRLWQHHPALVIALGMGITMAYGIFIFVSGWRFNRAFSRLREEEKRLRPESFRVERQTLPLVWEYRSRATLFGLPLVHCRQGRLPGQKLQPAVAWIASGDVAYGILFASGGVAIGGISMGGLSVGIISIGGFGVGILAFGGMALGAIALGGAAIGLIASGGVTLGWFAAIGGLSAAHEIALGGIALAKHGNDAVAREFFTRYHWLDITQTVTRNVFYAICFSPMFLGLIVWLLRRRQLKRNALNESAPQEKP
jgi:RNA polymerase sigma factor (sigma-70 family)